MNIYDFKCGHRINPVGVGLDVPVFGWKIKSENKNVKQTAYRLVIDGLYDSGRVLSDESVCVKCECTPKSETHYNYCVTVWDNYGESDEAHGFFETGISYWKAKFLEPKKDISVYKFTKKFKADCKNARIYATAYGLYDIYLNGKRVGDRLMTPGFTSYNKRIQYQTYEVELEGENCIEVHLARGWCAGRYPFQNLNRIYREMPSFIAEIHFDNQKICTDETWECQESPLRYSEIYNGEIYDATFETSENLEFNVCDFGYDNIVEQESEAVRITETLYPKEIKTLPNGDTVIDFGQNMTGFVEFTVSGEKGSKVILKHAEVLDKNGNFYTGNLRTARQSIEYILNGNGTETYHSRFSFQGFRYVKIEEFPGKYTKDNFKAHVIHTDMQRTGYFNCSNDMINKLYSNIVWGQRGNFVDIPTDCPQRDERVGWTGDAQVFCSTAVTNFDCALFFKKWLRDMASDADNGLVQIYVPAMIEKKTSAAWGDAATICPWQVYMAYGDTEMLREQYPVMKNWVEYIKRSCKDSLVWDAEHSYGDWLALDAKYGSYVGATEIKLISTAFFAYSSHLTALAAKELGYSDDEKKYNKLFDDIKKTFNYEFVTPAGRVSSHTQTAYVIALAFDLIDDKKIAAQRLAELIHGNGDRLTTGFVGTPYLCNVLAENGYEELAYTLLLQEKFPSWLFSVKMGATTVWEHWDGINEKGDFWSDNMNSFNHYAYGSIAEFMYRKCAGISPLAPGYKKILIKPVPDMRIADTVASIETPYGKVSVQKKITNEKSELKVTVPPNTCAIVVLPNGEKYEIGSGEYEF